MTVADRSLALARRFAELDPAARRALGEKLKAQGMSLESLPIPPRADAQAPVVASYAQRRLWTLWQLDRSSAAYNQAGVLRLDGALDTTALQAALDALVARHEILRTRFAETDGQLTQVVSAAAGVALAQRDVSASADPEAALKTALQVAAGQASISTRGHCCTSRWCAWASSATACCWPCTTSSPTAGRCRSCSTSLPKLRRSPAGPDPAAAGAGRAVRRLRLVAAQLAGSR